MTVPSSSRPAFSFSLIFATFLLCFASGCATWRGAETVTPNQQGISILNDGWQLQDIAKVKVEGDVLSQASYHPSSWYKATVPGTVLTTLVNNGVYPEPLYGENNRPDKIPDSLCRTYWWYRNKIVIPKEYAGKHVWLNFDGINYFADVWINGQHLGFVKGAFSRGVFDVTSFVEPGKPAAIAVKIIPPPHPGNPQEQTVALGTGSNGGALAQDGPTFLSTVGWDWIPAIRDRDMGIWQKVFLSNTGPVLVQDTLVTSDIPLPKTDSADLTIETSVRNVTDMPQTGVLHGTIGNDVNFEIPLTVQPNESQSVKLTPQTNAQLHLNNPRLWWPNGFGAPNLYSLKLSFDMNGMPSDAREISFGIRKITYEVPDSQNLTVSVNGVRVICKGGNWGMDEAMKRIPRERLEAQIRMHQLANYTMIRNWVGQSTSEDFYDLCDRYGIMVWDEFFQPNRSDGPNPNDVPLYLANVREKIVRFRNHPSIAIWCGRNESAPAPVEVADGIQKLMAELDPLRTYHANSNEGRGVRSGGPYSWQPPERYYPAAPGARAGGARNNVASTTTPTTGPSTAPTARGNRGGAARGPAAVVDSFKTEIGPVSIPTLESVHAMMPEKDWEAIDNDDWAEHDLARGAQEGRNNGQLYSETISQRFGKYANLADFVRKSQLANYEAHRALYEGRFSKMFTPYTGVLLWMSNPAQPSMVWQIYSHDLEPNASLFAVRKACEPVHIQMNQSDFHVMVINNTPQTIAGMHAIVHVIDIDGSQKKEIRFDLAAKPSAATDAGTIAFPFDLSDVHFVKLELRDADNKLVSDNFYWRALPAHPDDLTLLDSLARVQLEATVTRHDTGDKCLLDVELHNPTQTVALMSHVQLRQEKSNQRVLPTYYSDNYVSLLPGETRTITIEAAQKDLNRQTPKIMLDGWNTTVKSQSFSSAAGASKIATNDDAMAITKPTIQASLTTKP